MQIRPLLFTLAGVVLVGALISFLIPEKKTPTDPKRPPGPQVYDPYAGGYPVPPLPGQKLPPSPRKQRAAAAAAACRSKAQAETTTTPQVTQEVHGG